MNIYGAPSYLNAFKKLTRNKAQLKSKIKEKVNLFRNSPNHPQLKLHKLKGAYGDNWSFSVEDDLRIIFSYIENGVIFVDIGKHDEVY